MLFRSTNVDNSIELYTKMCSMNVTAESLANFALLLANGGICPSSGERLLKEETVRIVLSIMLTPAACTTGQAVLRWR